MAHFIITKNIQRSDKHALRNAKQTHTPFTNFESWLVFFFFTSLRTPGAGSTASVSSSSTVCIF